MNWSKYLQLFANPHSKHWQIAVDCYSFQNVRNNTGGAVAIKIIKNWGRNGKIKEREKDRTK